jgi:hypothetical protein
MFPIAVTVVPILMFSDCRWKLYKETPADLGNLYMGNGGSRTS